MKAKNIIFSLILVTLAVIQLNAQNTNPVVSNVAFSISGTTVTVTYNVTDAVQTSVTIIMLVSSNNGSTWDYNYGTATGDIGTNVSVGTNKTIQWTYTGAYNPNFKIRIYANDETADGSPCSGVETVNYGGKTYNTIQIGTQCWLKENLNIGIRINLINNQTNNGVIEKYCKVDYDEYCEDNGGLYQWAEAMQYVTTPGAKGICPTGWHIPTETDFKMLFNIVGNGNAIKKCGTEYSNTSGFSACMAGARDEYGNFCCGGEIIFWSSTKYDANYAENVRLVNYSGDYEFCYYPKTWGVSIRCIKN